MHIPMAEHNTRKESYYGWPGHFKSTKGNYRVTVYDPNNIGYTVLDNDIGIRTCASTGQYGAGNACNYRVSYWDQIAGYNGNTKNYITPKKFSVMIWFKMYGWSNSWNHLMGDVKPGGSTSWFANWVFRLQSSGVIRYYCCDGTPSNSGEVISNSSEIALNKIYLATMTYDGQTIYGYLNDRIIGTASYTAGIGNAEGSLELACDNQELGNILSVNGSIWDFRMYSAALSPAQVRNIYYNHWKLYSKQFPPSYLVGGSTIDLTLAQGFTASDEIGLKFGRLRTVTHTASLNQSIATNLGLQFNVTQGFTVDQSLGRAFLQSLTQSVTAAQVVGFDRSKYYTKHVSQSFAAYQNIGTRFDRYVTIVQSFNASDLPQNDLTNIRQSFGVTHVVAFNKEVNFRVTQDFSATDSPFVNSPRLLSLNHNLTASQAVSGRNSTNRQLLTHSFVATQVASGRNAMFRLTVSQGFTTSQTLYRRDAIIRMTIEHTFASAQRLNTYWNKRVEQDINIVDIIDAHRHIYRTFTTDTAVDDDFIKQRIIPRTLGDNVVVDSILDRQVIYTRPVGDTTQVEQSIYVTMQASAPKLYLPEIVDGPPAFGVPNTPRVGISGVTQIANLVKLSCGGSIILLPTPQLQNPLADVSETTINRTIGGQVVSYKKTTGQQRFSYTFFLDILKAYELRDWIRLNGAKKVTITNWRGEIWEGYVTTDQPEFTSETARQGDAIEKVVVTLDFQGVKIYG